MSSVFAVVEHLPIAGGVSQHLTHGEYPTGEAAWAAKQALYAARPELVGCLLIEMRVKADEPVPVAVETVEEGAGADGDVGRAAGGASGDGDGVQGARRRGGHAADVPALRPARGRVPGPPVEPAVPGAVVPEAGDERLD